MNSDQRQRLYDALMEPYLVLGNEVGDECAEMVYRDVRLIEPIIDEMVRDAGLSRLPSDLLARSDAEGQGGEKTSSPPREHSVGGFLRRVLAQRVPPRVKS